MAYMIQIDIYIFKFLQCCAVNSAKGGGGVAMAYKNETVNKLMTTDEVF